jgi:cytochrome c peroxidase
LKTISFALIGRLLLSLLLVSTQGISVAQEEEEADPAEVSIGERLFLETRFSYSAFAPRGKSDPVTDVTKTVSGALPGPFRGQTINCRACHLVDEQLQTKGGGMRTYSDFARRSPVTRRSDGNRTSMRNALQMVEMSTARNHGLSFHYDGEFVSLEDLTRATLTGRNFGWLPGEQAQAIRHIASVIRNDDGSGKLAREFGGAYARVLTGTDKSLPAELRLPKAYRVDVARASDKEIVDAVAHLISAYMRGIEFLRDQDGRFNGSPYDVFLQKNQLPRQPKAGESELAYSRRLRTAVNALDKPVYVNRNDGEFKYHRQQFAFGPLELEGMKIFFAESGNKAGNCIQCHSAPVFSDFGFHNTGVTQQEYDGVHGKGAFAALVIPGLDKRNADYNAFLPATPKHPQATSRFRSIPARDHTDYTDLGLWNVFANPDMPKPQQRLRAFMCDAVKNANKGINNCSSRSLLPHTIARFKTPVLRDLGHSSPYMHNGGFDTLESAIASYVDASEQARRGKLRNAAPELKQMRVSAEDVAPLTAFLKALNEDYE